MTIQQLTTSLKIYSRSVEIVTERSTNENHKCRSELLEEFEVGRSDPDNLGLVIFPDSREHTSAETRIEELRRKAQTVPPICSG